MKSTIQRLDISPRMYDVLFSFADTQFLLLVFISMGLSD